MWAKAIPLLSVHASLERAVVLVRLSVPCIIEYIHEILMLQGLSIEYFTLQCFLTVVHLAFDNRWLKLTKNSLRN